ncbi:PEP-CTERM sorting domain-containing protein [Okeania sp. SIO2B3]|uniref:PEP-CTERM sorting domain-containing protein n=1 Tax=Okeania sp. SIO2B3 TaxID=2607784 RepID=UPI0026006745|nr:PEP-CTERM sorting domain-containing protein [Okeania sp. SIO2B3]
MQRKILTFATAILIFAVQTAKANASDVTISIDFATLFKSFPDFIHGNGLDIGLTVEYDIDEGGLNIGANYRIEDFGAWNTNPLIPNSVNQELYVQTALYETVTANAVLATSLFNSLLDDGLGFYDTSVTLSLIGTGTINGKPFSLTPSVSYRVEDEKLVASVSGTYNFDLSNRVGFTVGDLFSENTSGELTLRADRLLENGDLEIDGEARWRVNNGESSFRFELDGRFTGLDAGRVSDIFGIREEIEDIGKEIGEDDIGLEELVPAIKLEFGLQPNTVGANSYDVDANIRVEKVSQTAPEPTSVFGLLTLGTLGAASTLKRKLKSSKSTDKELEKAS